MLSLQKIKVSSVGLQFDGASEKVMRRDLTSSEVLLMIAAVVKRVFSEGIMVE